MTGTTWTKEWAKALLRVGDGRGFVVGSGDRFVITASHCLPELPPCHCGSYPEERTFRVLGPLSAEACTITAECLFVDPVADLAVLGLPDMEVFEDDSKAYQALVQAATSLPIAELPLAPEQMKLPSGEVIFGPPRARTSAWVRALDGTWFRIEITAGTRALAIINGERNIASGMSGSPIVLDSGAAVGVVCSSGEDQTGQMTISPPNPFLVQQLPGWLLRAITGQD
jgi:hypothetical protein